MSDNLDRITITLYHPDGTPALLHRCDTATALAYAEPVVRRLVERADLVAGAMRVEAP